MIFVTLFCFKRESPRERVTNDIANMKDFPKMSCSLSAMELDPLYKKFL